MKEIHLKLRFEMEKCCFLRINDIADGKSKYNPKVDKKRKRKRKKKRRVCMYYCVYCMVCAPLFVRNVHCQFAGLFS